MGTPFYMAPEVLARRYGYEADVWSAGVVAYLMLAGRLPFDGACDREIITAVLDSAPAFDGPAWAGVSADARDCVASMLVKDPARRATIDQLLAHPWLAGRPRSCCTGSSGGGVGSGGEVSSSTAAAAAGAASVGDQPSQQQPQAGTTGSGSCSCSGGLGSRAGSVSWAHPCATAIDELSLPRHQQPASASGSVCSSPPPQLSPLKHCSRASAQQQL